MLKPFLVGIILLIVFSAQSQDTIKVEKDSIFILEKTWIDGEEVPHDSIEEIIIQPRRKFRSRRNYRRYTRLVRDLKRVYPYAQLAKEKLDEMEAEFQKLETEQERKKYAKTVEKQLMDQFGNELKKLTVRQGKLLLKLLDRQTGNTSYELLQTLRGNFSAIFWQAIAKLFGSDLKVEYDAEGEDYAIEQIILQIEMGRM